MSVLQLMFVKELVVDSRVLQFMLLQRICFFSVVPAENDLDKFEIFDSLHLTFCNVLQTLIPMDRNNLIFSSCFR